MLQPQEVMAFTDIATCSRLSFPLELPKRDRALGQEGEVAVQWARVGLGILRQSTVLPQVTNI